MAEQKEMTTNEGVMSDEVRGGTGRLSEDREPLKAVPVRGQVSRSTLEWVKRQPRCERCGLLVSMCKVFGCDPIGGS